MENQTDKSRIQLNEFCTFIWNIKNWKVNWKTQKKKPNKKSNLKKTGKERKILI